MSGSHSNNTNGSVFRIAVSVFLTLLGAIYYSHDIAHFVGLPAHRFRGFTLGLFLVFMAGITLMFILDPRTKGNINNEYPFKQALTQNPKKTTIWVIFFLVLGLFAWNKTQKHWMEKPCEDDKLCNPKTIYYNDIRGIINDSLDSIISYTSYKKQSLKNGVSSFIDALIKQRLNESDFKHECPICIDTLENKIRDLYNKDKLLVGHIDTLINISKDINKFLIINDPKFKSHCYNIIDKYNIDTNVVFIDENKHIISDFDFTNGVVTVKERGPYSDQSKIQVLRFSKTDDGKINKIVIAYNQQL